MVQVCPVAVIMFCSYVITVFIDVITSLLLAKWLLGIGCLVLGMNLPCSFNSSVDSSKVTAARC